jgi:predicted dithiol-disulfide oxidoreductase (DUF899 family)
MAVHKTGTREEWQAAHQKLLEAEKELAERGRKDLPQRMIWKPTVAVRLV